jgi:RNA polymerase sigma-70 factor, ECF subfamily
MALGILDLAEASDADLALAARDDARAFGELFVRHRVAVYRYLRARTTSDDEAAELTAVTFERAFVAMPRYRSITEAGPLPWLLRIARNAAIDAARRRGRDRALDALPPERLPADAVDPEAALVGAEELQRVRELVLRLPEPQRDAVILRYASGLPAREIAAVIGRSQSATEKLLVRGLARLKEAYRVEP